MITRRTKIQLMIFVLITVLGVSYVGARYAQLDRLLLDDDYTVVAHFSESGGIYEGAEVDYRGVKIGRVGKLELTDSGVDVHLDIQDDWDDIPADTLALVGNRSAVGEQYVELQPYRDGGPRLHEGSEISDTETPIPTEKLLTDISRTISSVDKQALTTTIHELGVAFQGTGRDLQTILDTSSSFVETADANFEMTRKLLRDGNTVLQGQIDSEGHIRSFARNLSLFTGTLRGSNKDLIRLIRNGSAGANELRTFLEENKIDLAQLISRVATTGEIVSRYIPSLEQILVTYPFIVEGGFTVTDRDPTTGKYNAHFGLVLTDSPICNDGYQGTDTRSPYDRGNRPMNTDARCTEPPSEASARGAQNHPRASADYEPNVVAAYDRESGTIQWGSSFGEPQYGRPAPAAFGSDSWKWLYLQPLTAGKRER